MKLITRKFDLPLKYTFTISYDSRNVQETMIVELHHKGYIGLGEATANPYYGITIQSMKNALNGIKGIVEKSELTTPEELWERIYPELQSNTFALCALDVAVNDLWGKINKKPLYQLWGLNEQNAPLTNYTIGIDSVDNMVRKLKECPWPIYKIKLGTKEDVRIVKELRRHTDSVFRVDANGAWNLDEAIQNSKALKLLGVEFIEQPLPASDWDGMKILYLSSALPLIADESCVTEMDVSRCTGHFHGINIKLMKCGGLTPARRMIAEAKKNQMKVMVGCMTESSVGISAIAQLLPLLDYVDMDGALLLSKDIARGVSIHYGKIIYSPDYGTGATLIE